MRIWFFLLSLVLLSANTSFAQKKVNKMNGLSEASITKKKYNKTWIKMRQQGLPSFGVSIGAAGGRVNYDFNEPGITDFGSFTFVKAPRIMFHINPTKNLGFDIGLGYRSTSYSYNTSGSFTNDSISATANGNWEQKFGNVGLSIGFAYYANIAKTISNCTGFGIVKSSTTHFLLNGGLIFAPALFNEVYFQGNYNKFVNGELRESNSYSVLTIMYNEIPRRDPMLFAYARAGIRVQSDGYAYRLGPVVEYQLNSNRGLVNDFTAAKSQISWFGLFFAFEFF